MQTTTCSTGYSPSTGQSSCRRVKRGNGSHPGRAAHVSALVLDTSVAVSLLLKDENSTLAVKSVAHIRAFETRYVCAHFWMEISNALLVAERKGRASQAEITVALRHAFDLPVVSDEETFLRCTDTTISLAREHGLTMYDAAYFGTSHPQGYAILATFDRALVRAAAKVGVQLLS